MALRHAETTFCRAELRCSDLRGDILKRQYTLRTNGAAPCRNNILPRRSTRRGSAWRDSQTPMCPADQWRCSMQKRYSAAQNFETRTCAQGCSSGNVPCTPMALRHAETTFCRAELRGADLRGEILKRQCTLQTNGVAACRNDIPPRRILRRGPARRDSQAPMYPADQWRCAMQKRHSTAQKCATRICAERLSRANAPDRPMALRRA